MPQNTFRFSQNEGNKYTFVVYTNESVSMPWLSFVQVEHWDELGKRQIFSVKNEDVQKTIKALEEDYHLQNEPMFPQDLRFKNLVEKKQ